MEDDLSDEIIVRIIALEAVLTVLLRRLGANAAPIALQRDLAELDLAPIIGETPDQARLAQAVRRAAHDILVGAGGRPAEDEA